MKSYSSAEVNYPSKILKNKLVLKMLENQKLSPIHVQLYPTNKCNLNCDFCSCSDRDRNQELGLSEIKTFFYDFIDTIQSITISGGGEPLMYSGIVGLVDFLSLAINKRVGMVTNGYLMKRYNKSLFDKLSWCRISLSKLSEENNLNEIIKPFLNDSKTDWSFSYVATDYKKDVRSIDLFFNQFKDKISHFRIVNDINSENDFIKDLKKVFIDPKFIFQKRDNFTKGMHRCYLAILKPVITASGDIQACCGSQYAINNAMQKDVNQLLSLGHLKDAKEIFKKNYFKTFSVCDKCYYDPYNKIIDCFFEELKHEEFI